MVIAGVAGLVLLTVGVASAIFLLTPISESKLSQLVPSNTTVFVEVPDAAKALLSFLQIDYLDSSQIGGYCAGCLQLCGRFDDLLEECCSSIE